jgi:hypothetical protein
LKKSSVSSGASSGSFQVAGVERFFAVISFPHADDATGLAARCPYQNYQSSIQPSCGYESIFLVLESGILCSEMYSLKYLEGSREVQTTFLQGSAALFRVILDPHVIIVHPINKISSEFDAQRIRYMSIARFVTRSAIFCINL